jgi:hypothetical protein
LHVSAHHETKEFEIAIQATNMVPSSNSFTLSSQTNTINGNKNCSFYEDMRNKKLNPDDTLNFTNSHKSTSSNSHQKEDKVNLIGYKPVVSSITCCSIGGDGDARWRHCPVAASNAPRSRYRGCWKRRWTE